MKALSIGMDALFADDNIAMDAIYTAGGGNPVLVRVVARRADSITGFGEARLWSETLRFDLRVSEVVTPRPGDRLEIGGEAFLTQPLPAGAGRMFDVIFQVLKYDVFGDCAVGG